MTVKWSSRPHNDIRDVPVVESIVSIAACRPLAHPADPESLAFSPWRLRLDEKQERRYNALTLAIT